MTAGHQEHGRAEKVLDLVLYAPVGAIDLLVRETPRLVADGRQRLEQRVRTARWIGEMAVTVGRQKVEQRWSALITRPGADDITSAGVGAQAGAAASVEVQTPSSTVEAPAEPFHGYDALPASELVQLLFRLTPGELELVRRYESATRSRRTVLAKVDQLLGAA